MFIEEAKIRGKIVTFDHFKKITKFSTQYDESGKRFNEDEYFYQDENGNISTKNFDELVRAPVYMLLKYKGSFKDFIGTEYFVDLKQLNKFYYNATPKMPFYLVHECSPQI